MVNNAGVCFVGTPEIMSSGDVDKIIDVNFRGTVNVTRKFLPLIRQSQGRVVNIGSLNGECLAKLRLASNIYLYFDHQLIRPTCLYFDICNIY